MPKVSAKLDLEDCMRGKTGPKTRAKRPTVTSSGVKFVKEADKLRNERVFYKSESAKRIVAEYDTCDLNIHEAIEKADIKTYEITPVLIELWRKTIPEFDAMMRNVEIKKEYELKSSLLKLAREDARTAKIYFDIFGSPIEAVKKSGKENSGPKGAVGFNADDFSGI